MYLSRLSTLFLACLLTGCATTAYRAKLPATDLRCSEHLAEITPQQLHYAAAVATKAKAKELPYVEFADVAQCRLDQCFLLRVVLAVITRRWRG